MTPEQFKKAKKLDFRMKILEDELSLAREMEANINKTPSYVKEIKIVMKEHDGESKYTTRVQIPKDLQREIITSITIKMEKTLGNMRGEFNALLKGGE